MFEAHSGQQSVGNETQMARNITREELKAKMDREEKFILLDELSAEHYESSYQ